MQADPLEGLRAGKARPTAGNVPAASGREHLDRPAAAEARAPFAPAPAEPIRELLDHTAEAPGGDSFELTPAAGRAAPSPARRPALSPWPASRRSQPLPIRKQPRSIAAVKGAELSQATIPLSGSGFGIAGVDDESGFGGDGRGGDGSIPLRQRVTEWLRIDETIESVRNWLWRVQPYLRGLASLVWPGWGQSLNGHPRKARAFRIASFVTVVAADILLFRERIAMVISLVVTIQASSILRYLGPIFLVGLFLWFLAAYDALIVSSTRRAAELQRPRAL